MSDWAARLLGWAGVVLPVRTLLGCRVQPVVVLDQAAHRARDASGDSPQLDGDTLTVWEWPESADAPRSVVTVSGVLVPAVGSSTRAWRTALGTARSWRGFGPTAVLAGPGVVADEVRRLEHVFHGVGLVPASAPSGVSVVRAEPGRCAGARRRTADRWIEEQLYRDALDAGLLDGAAR